MCKSAILFLVGLIGFGTASVIPKQECVFPITDPQQWKVFWPLIFWENGTLYETNEEGSVVVSQGDTVLISCGPNYVKDYAPKMFVTAKCEEGAEFLVENGLKLKAAEKLGCDLRSVEEVFTSVDGCPADQTGVKFGFVNPADSFSYITGEACYDVPGGKLLFAHVGLGDFEDAVLEVKNRNFFKAPFLPTHTYKTDLMLAFLLDEFNNRLRSALKLPRGSKVPEFTMNHYVDTDLLINGQLTSTKKLAWNYFVTHDDLKNYDRLKKDIASLTKTRDVFTGSSGILKLKDTEGTAVPVYVNNTVGHKRFPVPDYIWSIVKSGDRATAFIVFNDPSLTEEELEEKTFCQSKCDQIRWIANLSKDQNYLNRKHGAVVCCTYQEFKTKTKAVIPELSSITGLLK